MVDSRSQRAGTVLALLILALSVLLIFWRLVFTNRVLGSGDAFAYFTPYRDYLNDALSHGRLPLWNPYLFLGVPFLANPQTAVLYPLHWPFLGLPAAKSLVASLVLHLWLAGVGTYIYVRRVPRLGQGPALMAGLVFSLGGFLSGHAGQVNQVSTAAWLPWLLWLLEEAWGSGTRADGTGRRGSLNLVGLAGLGLVIGLQFLAGHTQTSFINLVGLVLAALWPGLAALLTWAWARLRRRPESLAQGELKQALGRFLVLVTGLALGALLAAAQLVPTWELAQESVRSGGLSYQEAVSFSLRPRGLLLTLLPSYGEDLAQRFATPAFGEFVAYVGIGALVLAALGILAARRRARELGPFLASPLGLATAFVFVGLFLGLGAYNPLYFVLYKLVPGFDLFRAPARWMVLYTLGIAVMAAYGLSWGVTTPRRIRPGNSDLGRRATTAWRGMSPWARVLVIVLALIGLILLAWQVWPGPLTVVLWLVAAGLAFGLATRAPARLSTAALGLLLLAELAGASLVLDHTRPTAPEAVTSLRTAPAHLLAARSQAEAAGQVPGRFLSLSGITYDPGDLPEIEEMLAGQLPPEAIYDYVVASKMQEIVAPNLSLLWRLPAADGYDGGVLPLSRYVDLQTLFVPAEELSPDGRLREQLDTVPPSRLLAMLNLEHVITDKGFDVWLDDVYYDLELSSVLEEDRPQVVVDSGGRLESTAIGVFTHLEGGLDLANGIPVAEVVVIGAEGESQSFVLRAGQDTAEGAWNAGAAHLQPMARQPWPREPAGWDYLARLDLTEPLDPARVTVRWLAPQGKLVLRGISLIDERTGTHAALTVPADGEFQRVHSGDVKIYRNQTVLPRAYAVGQARVVAGDQAALAVLADPAFAPSVEVVLLQEDLLEHGLAEEDLNVAPEAAASAVKLASYAAEEVVLDVDMSAPGVLVLSDTWYPGWQVMVDGSRAPLLRANLLLRGVLLEQGMHRLAFEFRPASLQVGGLISGIGGLLLATLLLVGWVRQRRRRAELSVESPPTSSAIP